MPTRILLPGTPPHCPRLALRDNTLMLSAPGSKQHGPRTIAAGGDFQLSKRDKRGAMVQPQ